MEKCSECNEPAEAIIAFDTLYTTNHLQMLKLLLPYLDMDNQHRLAMYIKWQELMYTISFGKRYLDSACKTRYSPKKELDISGLLPLLFPYCSEEEKNTLSQFSQMQNMMKTWQDVAQYLPMIQEMMGTFSSMTGNSPGNTGSCEQDGMMEMLKNMMSPQQQSMFSLFMEGGIP